MKVNVSGKVEIRTRITLAGKDQIKAFSLSKSDNHIISRKKKYSAVREACMAKFGDTPSLDGKHPSALSSEISRGGANFCVRSTPLRDATRRSLHN